MINKLSVLIPAAGKGKRSGLSYPKTLYEINGKPILIHIFDLINLIDNSPTVIVSPSGINHIKKCLKEHNKKASLIIQESPKGMGDAILKFEKSPYFRE